MCGTLIPIGTRTCRECGERLPVIQDRRRWPIYVRMGLWLIHSRKTAWECLWSTVAIGLMAPFIALGVAIFVNKDVWLLVGLLTFFGMALAAFWYYVSILWVDRHDTWTKP
jgi:hypothetical protein